MDGKRLLDDLRQLLARFVILPRWAAETLALWTLHTYAFQMRDVSTYIGIESPEKRCGKTTLLTVLSELVSRPVVAANISSPAFFRVIQETHPTLLIDEADVLLQGNDQLRGILNAGYTRKTAFVVRVANSRFSSARQPAPAHSPDQPIQQSTNLPCAPFALPASQFRLARFSCWCPKVIAAIGRLPDTLADRCILIRMQRKTAREQCDRLRHLDAVPLTRQCARFILDHAADIAAARPEIPPDLHDRAADIWEPLLALADLAGGDWPTLARQTATALTATAQENSPIGALLLDIFLLFTTARTDRLFSRILVAGLNSLSDRPWAETRRGKNVTELWLAQQLRPYGVRPRTMWIGHASARGYVQDDFRDAFQRYIPKAEFEALKAEWAAADAAPPPSQPDASHQPSKI